MDILTIIAIFVTGVGGYYGVKGIKSGVKDSNISDLSKRVEILEKERDELKKAIQNEREVAQKQHLENQKSISNLEGQLATYKEIPLKSIADSLAEIPKLVTSNQHILDRLDTSADIAAKQQSDGGTLVKTKPSNPIIVGTKEDNPLDVKPVEGAI